MEYILILLAIFLLTLLLERVFRVHLYHNRRERFEVVVLFFFVGVIWDSFSISRGYWLFPRDHTLGVTLGNMPLEEYVFMLVQPYFILTVYKVIDGHVKKRRP